MRSRGLRDIRHRADSNRAQLVMDLLRKLATEQEACIITVTHDEKIFDRFDRLIHLRDGHLVCTDDITRYTSDQLVSLMVGRDLESELSFIVSCMERSIRALHPLISCTSSTMTYRK